MTNNTDEIDSLRQQLAESQARVKELEEALKKAVETTYSDSLFETWNKLLANKSPSSALDRAIRQAKVEALEGAADAFELVNKQTNVGVWNGDAVTGKLRRMADELRNAP